MTRAHDNTDKKFGTAIRLARKKHKLTQMQLGEALGVTFQQIQKYEKGTNAVASTRISELCRVLKISPDDLFDFQGTVGATNANQHLGSGHSSAAGWT